MNSSEWIRRYKLGILLAFLVISIASLHAIPALKPWGADLHNLQIFQQCAHGESPYPIDATKCGDIWKRPMIYPPLMYHTFIWLRGLTLSQAMYLWTAFLIVSFSALMFAWVKYVTRESKSAWAPATLLFGALLLFQFPFVFSLERGSTDIGSVLFWTLAAYFFERRKLAISGLMAGLAASYKLYPIFACLIIAGALLASSLRTRAFPKTAFLRFGAAAAASFILSNVVFSDARYYFFTILPKFAKVTTASSVNSHSIPSFVGAEYPWFARLITLLLVGIWIFAAERAILRRGALVFAGALAVSTFNQGTSWDYNLTTAYPFLLLLFIDAYRTGEFAVIALGVFSICADRSWFADANAHFFTPTMHLALELAFIVVAAAKIASEKDTAEPSVADAAAKPIAESNLPSISPSI